VCVAPADARRPALCNWLLFWPAIKFYAQWNMWFLEVNNLHVKWQWLVYKTCHHSLRVVMCQSAHCLHTTHAGLDTLNVHQPLQNITYNNYNTVSLSMKSTGRKQCKIFCIHCQCSNIYNEKTSIG